MPYHLTKVPENQVKSFNVKSTGTQTSNEWQGIRYKVRLETWNILEGMSWPQPTYFMILGQNFHIDSLGQDYNNFSVLAMELPEVQRVNWYKLSEFL